MKNEWEGVTRSMGRKGKENETDKKKMRKSDCLRQVLRILAKGKCWRREEKGKKKKKKKKR